MAQLPARLALAASLLVPAFASAQSTTVELTGTDAEASEAIVIADTAAAHGGLGTRLLNPRYSTASPAFDGVVRIFMKDRFGVALGSCTGSLLNGGKDILTAAHCVAATSGPNVGQQVAYNADLYWRRSDGTVVSQTNALASVRIMPGYTGSVIESHDLAILRLGAAAPSWATGYSLFDGDPFFRQATFAGYGLIGDGLTGDQYGGITGQPPVRLQGLNAWEASRAGNTLYAATAYASKGVLVYDFDNGRANRNTMCLAFGGGVGSPLCDAGSGLNEVALGHGDSGGPGFVTVDGRLRIAGVASWVSRGYKSDGTTCAQYSCFGAIGGHVDVSYAENEAWLATTAPEPGTWALLATGLVGVAGVTVRRRRGR